MGPANKTSHLKVRFFKAVRYHSLLLFVATRVTKKYPKTKLNAFMRESRTSDTFLQNSVAASKNLMIFDLVKNSNELSEGVLLEKFVKKCQVKC